MNRALLLASIFLIACSNEQSSPANAKQKQKMFYDYKLSIDFIDPFLGLERSYALTSDTMIILNKFFSKEGKLTKADSIYFLVTKPQLDTIYIYAAELFAIDKENLTDGHTPEPPYGEGNIARVTFDLNSGGDRYVRDLRKIDTMIENSFSHLYLFMLKTQRSR